MSFEYIGLLKNIKKSHDISIVVKKVSFWMCQFSFEGYDVTMEEDIQARVLDEGCQSLLTTLLQVKTSSSSQDAKVGQRLSMRNSRLDAAWLV